MKRAPFPNPNWWKRNTSDNQEFFGYDNDNGTTSWYTPDGIFDSETRTPNPDSISDEYKIWEVTLIEL